MHRTVETRGPRPACSRPSTWCVCPATAAHASVTIDAAGKGFVGKGNVQTALGWNDKQLQDAIAAKSLVTAAAADDPVAHPRASSQAGTQAGAQDRHPGRHPGPHPDRHARSCRKT